MNSPEFPTPWQKKSNWAALTTLSIVAIGAVAVVLIWTFSTVMAYLQPILVPFAVAGVLAMKWLFLLFLYRHRIFLRV